MMPILEIEEKMFVCEEVEDTVRYFNEVKRDITTTYCEDIWSSTLTFPSNFFRKSWSELVF